MTDPITAFLSRPGMMTCEPLRGRWHEKFCLQLQRRFKAVGEPTTCSPACKKGRSIRAKYPRAKTKDFQVNGFYGGVVTAGLGEVGIDAPAAVCPAKRLRMERENLKEAL